MFTVLKLVHPPKKGWLKKIRAAYGWLPVEAEKQYAGDVPFYLLKCVPSQKGIVWSKVEKTAGPLAAKMVLPQNVVPPRGSTIIAYDYTEFARRLLVNFALETMKKAAQRKRLCAVLVDIQGRCTGVAVELLRCCAELTILTMHASAYDGCLLYTTENMGVTPVISSDPQIMDWADLIIAPYGFEEYCLPPLKTPVFSSGSGRMFMSVEDHSVVLPYKYMMMLPAGVMPIAFGAACYESGFARDLGYLTPPYLIQNNRKITPAETIRKICGLT